MSGPALRAPAKAAGFLRRPLDTVLAAPSHLFILRVLLEVAVGLTGREVARRAGLSPKAALDALTRLEAAGIVGRLPAGRAHLFRLRREHYLVRRCLGPLFGAEKGYRDEVVRAIQWGLGRHAVSGVLFGSAARGEDRPESDLDLLLIVRHDKEEALDAAVRLGERLEERAGVRLAPVVLTVPELRKDYGLSHPLLRNILRDGVLILGRAIAEILRG